MDKCYSTADTVVLVMRRSGDVGVETSLSLDGKIRNGIRRDLCAYEGMRLRCVKCSGVENIVDRI